MEKGRSLCPRGTGSEGIQQGSPTQGPRVPENCHKTVILCSGSRWLKEKEDGPRVLSGGRVTQHRGHPCAPGRTRALLPSAPAPRASLRGDLLGHLTACGLEGPGPSRGPELHLGPAHTGRGSSPRRLKELRSRPGTCLACC